MFDWWRRLWQRSRPVENSFGLRGEQAAEKFLIARGFRILARNWKNRWGEIDLIALDGDTIVFIEVKSRRSTVSGQPVEAVTPQKQRQLAKLAVMYLKQQRWLDRRARFDVVAVLWPEDSPEPTLTHYVHAFESSGLGSMYS